MTVRRLMLMAGGAVAPIALLAVLFNNQWVVDAIRESDFKYTSGIGPLVGTFQYPIWRLTPAGVLDWGYVLAVDFAFLLFLVLLALLVFVGARTIDPRQGMLGAVITGWWATTVAGGLAGVVGGALISWAIGGNGFPTSTTIWNVIGNGAGFGFLFGWIAGLGALGGFVIGRPRTAAQQPYGVQQPYAPQQPYAAQQPYPPQQPGPQMPQQGMPQPGMQPPHPSAVPYVPPQGQPQQPAWGGPAIPQQPGAPQPGAPAPQQPESPAPQQFGAPPVPPQEPPRPAQEPQQGPSEPGAAADDAEEPSGPNAEPPADTPEDDNDLDLADRTIVDRRREDD